MKMRDDFPKAVVETLAKRVGNHCSNPGCRKLTSGPHTEGGRVLNVGVAAHVTAASLGGPRYDSSLTPEDRKGIGNGIWLCQSCAKLVDNDEVRYTTDLLAQWKLNAEQEALREIESPSGRTRLSDMDALKEYSAHFDRAALQDSLRNCGSYKKFAAALGELISLLNTGAVREQTVAKRRAEFDNIEWRKSLENLYHAVRELRELYTSLVRSGEIDEDKCTCQFSHHKMFHVFDRKKQEIINQLNAILSDANLPSIRC